MHANTHGGIHTVTHTLEGSYLHQFLVSIRVHAEAADLDLLAGVNITNACVHLIHQRSAH